MSEQIVLTPAQAKEVKAFSACFPGYRGKKFQINVSVYAVNCKSYWDGGTHSEFRFYDLATNTASASVPAQSMFDKQVPGLDSVTPSGSIVIVEHCHFCGKDMGLRIHAIPGQMNMAALKDDTELSREHKIVLVATRSLKSAYRLNGAMRETGITEQAYKAAQSDLNAMGLLKRNAITPQGRNAIGRMDFYELRQSA